jgi:hypothetical protein
MSFVGFGVAEELFLTALQYKSATQGCLIEILPLVTKKNHVH